MSGRVTRSSTRSTPSMDVKPSEAESAGDTPKLEFTKPETPPSRRSKRVKTSVKVEEETSDNLANGASESANQTEKKETLVEAGQSNEGQDAVKEEESIEVDQEEDTSKADGKKKTTKRKRVTKEETKETVEMLPLAARTQGLRMFVGAHISSAGGLQNSIPNIAHVGGNAWALFLKSPQKWNSAPIPDESRDAFHKACQEQKYDQSRHCLPHGSYLVNLAQDDKIKAKQAYGAFLDDLQRCEALGIKLYNFHPGAAGQTTMESALTRLAGQLTSALKATSTVIPVLETMCGQGTVIGGDLQQFRDIFDQIPEEYHTRLGVCLDTCHSFAAGYDIRTKEGWDDFMNKFDKIIGLRHLRALHINDSKTPLGSHRDLHANIGTGFLGLRAFHHVMNEPRLEGMPLVLETPIERAATAADKKGGKKTPKNGPAKVDDYGTWAREIKLLESLIGMDMETEEFKKLEKELSDKGKAEREKHQAQFDKKQAEAKRKEERVKQRSLKDMFAASSKKKKKEEKEEEVAASQ